ncbi:MAG: ATP-binding cassette domain-containing protein, partial [Luteibaculum sp.]
IDEIELSKIPVSQRATKMAYVASNSPAVNQFTVENLIELNNRQSPQYGLHKELGISHLLQNRLIELSDGELQKAYILRALCQNTPYIILDEPFAHLDVAMRIETCVLLQKIARSRNIGIICSSHDVDFSLRIADQIILMEQGGQTHFACPEDLILDGKIGETFNSPNVAFNLEAGHFEYCLELHSELNFYGEGSRARWLKNALARNGFGVKDCSQVEATIVCEENLMSYKNKNYRSVGELLKAVLDEK